MRRLCFRAEDVHAGDLILVNGAYGCAGAGREPLVPVQDSHILLDRRAAALLSSLMEEIHGWRQILPVSGWRSLEEQRQIWDSTLKESGLAFTEKYVARPGHSEHQTGLAIDLGLKGEEVDFICPDFPYQGICQTFRRRAAEYGFIQRYPAGKEAVTGIGHEPWHFRYVGVPHARLMVEMGLTLEEYLLYLRRFPWGEKPLACQIGGRRLEISYLPAQAGETCLELAGDWPCLVSGDNMEGYIVTLWKGGGET